jgi:RNA polymerase sigma-70 factor, ECF subfamily
MAVTLSAGDVAEGNDLVQEAFARAYANAATFRGDGPLAGWVWRILLNHGSRVRAGKRQAVAVNENLVVALPDPAADPELQQALQSLSPRQRTVVFLRFYADLSYEEIATALDVQPRSWSNRTSRGSDSLQTGGIHADDITRGVTRAGDRMSASVWSCGLLRSSNHPTHERNGRLGAMRTPTSWLGSEAPAFESMSAGPRRTEANGCECPYRRMRQTSSLGRRSPDALSPLAQRTQHPFAGIRSGGPTGRRRRELRRVVE